MNVSVMAQGRFGSSISSLTDLNGDGLKDVAVGAPLEDDHRGAVYIYLGEKLKGIRPEFSQVRQTKMEIVQKGSKKMIKENIHPSWDINIKAFS